MRDGRGGVVWMTKTDDNRVVWRSRRTMGVLCLRGRCSSGDTMTLHFDNEICIRRLNMATRVSRSWGSLGG